VFARIWVGSAAKQDRARVLARALGARDLALGAGGLLALRSGDPERTRHAFAAQAFADAVDLLAIVGAGRRVPLPARSLGATMGAGSAAAAAAYVRRIAADEPRASRARPPTPG
jgi:hypothetical protein